MFPCTTGLFVPSGPRCNKRFLATYWSEKLFAIAYDSKYPHFGHLSVVILCQLETHPEAVRGLPRPPALLAESTLSIIRHVAGLHVRVAPDAFERLVHVHLSPRKQRKA